MFRGLVPAIAIMVGLCPAMARAQTNIDAGKSATEMFTQDCATCHKSARGLANGRGSSALAGYLREHYTSNQQQATALAAYVLGAGGGEAGAAAQGRGQKPAQDHASVPADQSKPTGKPAAKPEEHAPATAKLQRPADEETKPAREPHIMPEPGPDTPGHRPTAGRRDTLPAAASRGRRNEPEIAAPVQEPGPANTEPAAQQPPTQEPSPESNPGRSAAAPENPESGDGASVPRDNIPD